MTPKQTRIYWAAWGAVRKADPSADRHELHRRAFNGQDKSSKDFNTTTDLDAVLAVFRSISEPANLNAQLRPFHQAEKRVTHGRMNHVALLKALGIDHADAYLGAILRDRFKAKYVSDLSQAPTRTGPPGDPQRGPSELMQYIFTVSRAIDRLRAKKKWTLHDLYTAACLDCPCLACRQRRALQKAAPVTCTHPF